MMTWTDHVTLATGNYTFRVEVYPFATGPGLSVDFYLSPVHPTTGNSVIKTRWVPGMPDLGFTFVSSSLIPVSESHVAPLDQFIEYSMEVCIYANEPP